MSLSLRSSEDTPFDRNLLFPITYGNDFCRQIKTRAHFRKVRPCRLLPPLRHLILQDKPTGNVAVHTLAKAVLEADSPTANRARHRSGLGSFSESAIPLTCTGMCASFRGGKSRYRARPRRSPHNFTYVGTVAATQAAGEGDGEARS